jgi:hypothetical protein
LQVFHPVGFLRLRDTFAECNGDPERVLPPAKSGINVWGQCQRQVPQTGESSGGTSGTNIADCSTASMYLGIGGGSVSPPKKFLQSVNGLYF